MVPATTLRCKVDRGGGTVAIPPAPTWRQSFESPEYVVGGWAPSQVTWSMQQIPPIRDLISHPIDRSPIPKQSKPPPLQVKSKEGSKEGKKEGRTEVGRTELGREGGRERMNKQTNERTNRRTGEQMNERKKERMNEKKERLR